MHTSFHGAIYYTCKRANRHLEPTRNITTQNLFWSVHLAAHIMTITPQDRGKPGVQLNVTYQYEAYAGFHVVQLHTEGAPILLFSDPMAIPNFSPWDLCAARNLGSMESNVMAGRALFGCLQLPDGQRRCAIFLVHEKVTQGSSKSAAYRAYRRIAPKSLELVIISQPVAKTFCGRLLLQHLPNAAYFDPGTDWPKPIELNATLPIILEQLAFLGDTRSRRELLVFSQANPARLPLTMGILQPDIPVRRMANERKTKLTDALVRILCRFFDASDSNLTKTCMIYTCETIYLP